MLRMRLGQWADSLYNWLCCVSCGFNLMGQPKEENNVHEARRRGDAETRRSEKGKILAGKNEPFPPLNSASPRLLFDFSRFNEPRGLRTDPHETPQSRIYSAVFTQRKPL